MMCTHVEWIIVFYYISDIWVPWSILLNFSEMSFFCHSIEYLYKQLFSFSYLLGGDHAEDMPEPGAGLNILSKVLKRNTGTAR